MEKILNQEEIDKLFHRSKQSAPKHPVARRRVVKECDFRQGGQLSKDQVRQLTSLHDNFAPSVSNSLGAYLRVAFQMSLVAVEQLTYSEFLGRLPEQTYFSTALLMPVEETAALQMDLPLIFPMIDLLLGGSGNALPEARDLTEIEEQIATTVIGMLWRELQATWQASWRLEFQPGARLKQSQIISLVPSAERVLNVSFEIQLKEVRGVLNLIFPAIVSNVLLRKLSQQGSFHRRRHSVDTASRIRERLLDSSVTVNLDLAHIPLRIRDIVDMQQGTILSLRHSVDEPMLIALNGTAAYKGIPVSCGPTRGGLIQSKLPMPELVEKERT
jgi:flagellar motor switch protein FliM